MKETSKAQLRRNADKSFPWDEIFQGALLDVGSGDDPLDLPNCIHFNLPDGGGDLLTKFYPPESFHCIHGSQVLEHMLNPVTALNSWIRCLRPNGYIVATVPSWELYEHYIWPSRFNRGHQSTWSLEATNSPARIHCKLPEWLEQFPVKVLRCVLVATNYDYLLSPGIDQTFEFDKMTEVFCEFVVQRL